jgi:hypothetical protein
MRNRPPFAPLLLLLAVAAAACRRQPAPSASPPASSAGAERDALLRQISSLPEVAPCLAGAGAEPAIRLTAAELAGEAASASFACTRAPVAGQVTFFRIGGGWVVSTKQLSGAAAVP